MNNGCRLEAAREMFPDFWFVIHADGSGWARFKNLQSAILHAGFADTIEGPIHKIED